MTLLKSIRIRNSGRLAMISFENSDNDDDIHSVSPAVPKNANVTNFKILQFLDPFNLNKASILAPLSIII